MNSLRKLFGNPIFAVLFSVFLIVVSSAFNTKWKLNRLTPDQVMQYASHFPGRLFI